MRVKINISFYANQRIHLDSFEQIMWQPRLRAPLFFSIVFNGRNLPGLYLLTLCLWEGYLSVYFFKKLQVNFIHDVKGHKQLFREIQFFLELNFACLMPAVCVCVYAYACVSWFGFDRAERPQIEF